MLSLVQPGRYLIALLLDNDVLIFLPHNHKQLFWKYNISLWINE